MKRISTPNDLSYRTLRDDEFLDRLINRELKRKCKDNTIVSMPAMVANEPTSTRLYTKEDNTYMIMANISHYKMYITVLDIKNKN